jgi:hypothetical protein
MFMAKIGKNKGLFVCSSCMACHLELLRCKASRVGRFLCFDGHPSSRLTDRVASLQHGGSCRFQEENLRHDGPNDNHRICIQPQRLAYCYATGGISESGHEASNRSEQARRRPQIGVGHAMDVVAASTLER